jgi:hypothetical protein
VYELYEDELYSPSFMPISGCAWISTTFLIKS